MAVQPHLPSPRVPFLVAAEADVHLDSTATGDPQRMLRQGLGLLTLGLIVFVAWQYLFPPEYQGMFFGINPRGADQFGQQLFHAPLPHLRGPAWSLGFRCLILLLWAGYALAILAGLQHSAIKPSLIIGLMAGASLILAVACPPLLTTDCYSYVSYAHLHVFYGLNPYVTTSGPLFAHHDPVTRFLFWKIPTIYGPLWTGLADGVVRLFPTSLWGQIVGMKLIGAAALCGSAFAGRRLAEHFQPGRGPLTLLAIGLNPLLLIEGPGNGHNDLLMVCFALWAAALFVEKKLPLAGLLLGLSIGIKLITLALLPWLILTACRQREGRRAGPILGMALAALAPTVLGYLPFWHGPDTFAAMALRSSFHVSDATLAQDARVSHWLSRHGIGTGLRPVLVALSQHAALLLLYLALSFWLCRTRITGAWLTAWMVLTAALMLTGMGMAFPWYIGWFWPLALVRWNRLSVGLSTACFVMALTYESFYSCIAVN